ncbi:MAG: hypothetical protein ACREMC_05025, partial [Gemmatimonadales bacterium]
TAIVPRGLRRETVRIQDHGPAATTLNGDPAVLRHIGITGGTNGVVDLWLDSAGRLMKVAIPSRRLTAERTPSG